jgi:hypothetical protein
MKLAKIALAAGLGLGTIAGTAGIAGATEPGQLPCTLGLESDGSSLVTSPGANDCIVRYSTEDAALTAIYDARARGLYIWHLEGFIVPDSGGFVVRASVATPDFEKPLEAIMSPA